MTLTYEFTQSDYIAAQRMHAWRRYKPETAEFFMRWNPLVGIVLFSLGIFFFVQHFDHWAAWVECLIGTYFMFVGALNKTILARRYRRTRIGTGPLTLRFEDDAIYSDCEGSSSSRIEYSAIKSLRPTTHNIVIYLAPAVFLAIPRRVLSEGQQSDLVGLINAKLRLPRE